MPKYFDADLHYGMETSRDMDLRRPGTRILPGIAKAHLTVYDADERCSDTLPTIADLLASHIDPRTGLLSLRPFRGLDLLIDPTPLRTLHRAFEWVPGTASSRTRPSGKRVQIRNSQARSSKESCGMSQSWGALRQWSPMQTTVGNWHGTTSRPRFTPRDAARRGRYRKVCCCLVFLSTRPLRFAAVLSTLPR